MVRALNNPVGTDSESILLARLSNQMLAAPATNNPADIVRALGAVQSQDYAGAKWGVAQRTNNITSSAFDAAFSRGDVLRTHALRPTWHFVATEDLKWMLALNASRINAYCATYWHKLAMSEDMFARANDIIAQSVAGTHLTRTEIDTLLKDNGLDTSDGRLGFYLIRAEQEGIICSGPLRGKNHTYAAISERVANSREFSRDQALQELATRYFTSHGPATLADFAWWSGLTAADAAKGLKAIKSKLISHEVQGQIFWLMPQLAEYTMTLTNSFTQIHLLPNYDEYVVAYKDRTYLHDSDNNHKLDSRKNPLFNHVIIEKGRIAGTWSYAIKKDTVLIRPNYFTEQSLGDIVSLKAAMLRFEKFLGLPVEIAPND